MTGKSEVGKHWKEVLRELHDEAFKGLYIDPVVHNIKFPCKLLFSPDSHGNYWNPKVTEEMLNRDGDASIVLTNEIVSADAFSHFRQEYKPDMISEMVVTGKFIEMLKGKRNRKRRVIISNSNHQERFMKMVADCSMSSEAVEAAGMMWKAGLEVYAGLKAELTDSFVVQVGRALFGHPDQYISTQGTVAQRFLQKMNCRYPEFGLKPPFQLAAVGHPHRLNMTQVPGHRAFAIEAGCQCYTPRYAIRDNRTLPCSLYPMVNGYAVVEFDKNGNVYSASPVFIGWGGIPKRK